MSNLTIYMYMYIVCNDLLYEVCLYMCMYICVCAYMHVHVWDGAKFNRMISVMCRKSLILMKYHIFVIQQSSCCKTSKYRQEECICIVMMYTTSDSTDTCTCCMQWSLQNVVVPCSNREDCIVYKNTLGHFLLVIW